MFEYLAWFAVKLVANENGNARQARLHVDRTAGGHRHHRDSGGVVVAGAVAGQDAGLWRRLPEQSAPTGFGLAHVCG